MKHAIILLAVLTAATRLSAAADPAPAPVPVQDAALAKWRDARFGMFIHWGPVSLTGREIGWSRGAQTPVEEYDALYKKFDPVKFNADEWVKAAKDAGMKYIVLTTKHHDAWKTVLKGNKIGSNYSSAKFPAVTANDVRLNILKATNGPTISEIQLTNDK